MNLHDEEYFSLQNAGRIEELRSQIRRFDLSIGDLYADDDEILMTLCYDLIREKYECSGLDFFIYGYDYPVIGRKRTAYRRNIQHLLSFTKSYITKESQKRTEEILNYISGYYRKLNTEG